MKQLTEREAAEYVEGIVREQLGLGFAVEQIERLKQQGVYDEWLVFWRRYYLTYYRYFRGDEGEVVMVHIDQDAEWVSVDHAAEMLGITKSRIYTLIRNGQLTSETQKGRKMVSYAEVKARMDNPPKAGRRW